MDYKYIGIFYLRASGFGPMLFFYVQNVTINDKCPRITSFFQLEP